MSSTDSLRCVHVLTVFKSINVIECQQLRAIFLMLREELKDSDIPHRTTIRNRILEVWDEHLDRLQKEMEVALLISMLSC